MTVIRKKDLSKKVALQLGCTNSISEEVINCFLAEIRQSLLEDKKVILHCFCSIQNIIRKYDKNDSSKKARLRVAFKASKGMKDDLKLALL